MPSLYFCAAAAHLIDVFVTLDMVDGDKMLSEIILIDVVIFCLQIYISKMSAHTGLSENCDVGATTLFVSLLVLGRYCIHHNIQ